MTLTVTMHDTFLSSGTLSKDVDLDFLKEYGSLYPESFPGELAGSCTLIENADLRQDGNTLTGCLFPTGNFICSCGSMYRI